MTTTKKYFSFRNLLLLGIVSLTLFSARYYEFFETQNAVTIQPVGPYLDGKLPERKPDPGNNSYRYEVVQAFPNLSFIDPVKLVETPDDRFIVAGKTGLLWSFDPSDTTTVNKTLILDIEDRVESGVDIGLIGIVLHPDFGKAGDPDRGYIYVWYRYTPNKGSGAECNYRRLSRFTWNDGASTIDENSEYVLIQQYGSCALHMGGDMFFGTDGFLYLPVGDAGGGDDFYGSTQVIDKWLLSGVLRIDVDMQGGAISHPIRRQPIDLNTVSKPQGWPSSFTQGYYIPNDNPWLDPSGGILEEFYAIGLRSPHRMTYDTIGGKIWLGDIGQNSREEINLIEKGKNYQWPFKEGTIDGIQSRPGTVIGTEQGPVFDYPRSFGQAVIGGYYIRNNPKYPELVGKYLFGDHEVQNIWTLTEDPGGGAPTIEFLINIPVEGFGSKDGISSFFLANDGTFYILDLFGTGLDGGKIRKLVREPNNIPDPPDKLSDLNIFTDMTNLTPRDGIIPYETVNQLWSDRSLKKRWIALPTDGDYSTPDEKIVFSDENNWEFPEGTVFIKHFDMPMDDNDPSQVKKISTRIFVMDSEGTGYGLTYKWNDAETEAFLLSGADAKDFTITATDNTTYTQTWLYPSREQCLSCHTAIGGYTLGVVTRNLNKAYTYPSNVTANQLDVWNSLGIFDQDIGDAKQYPQLAAMDDQMSSEEFRVRSYLESNCSYCHQNSGANGALKTLTKLALYDQVIVDGDVISSNSTVNGKVVVPGDHVNSEIYKRVTKSGNLGGMPPIGVTVFDTTFINSLTNWIDNLNPAGPASITEGWYFIENRLSNKVLGVINGSTQNNSIVVQQTNTGASSQKWYVEDVGNNKVRLTNSNSEFALAIETMESKEGVNIVQQEVSSKQHEFWYFEETDPGYYVIKSVYNSLGIDLLGTPTQEGANAITRLIKPANLSQHWELVPTTASNTTCSNPQVTYLSDLPTKGDPIVGSGFGLERDRSVEEFKTISIDGTTYPKGLSSHSYTEFAFDISGNYETFKCTVGNDDEVGNSGSVQFEFYLDGTLVLTTPVLYGNSAGYDVEINVVGANELKLVGNDGGDGVNSDHPSWGGARLETCSPPDCSNETDVELSSLTWFGTPINGSGSPNIDNNNDGGPMTIGGQSYSSGIGVRTDSEIIYKLNGRYETFKTDIGVDNGAPCTSTSITFEVYFDGLKVYESVPMAQATTAINVELDVTGVIELRLVVNDGGGGIDCNANWAGAIIEYCGDPDLGIFSDNDDIGTVGIAGTAYHIDGLYTIASTGDDIITSPDEFNFTYKSHSGDGEIIARLKKSETTANAAKAGVMFRATGTQADRSYAMVVQQPNNEVYFQWRETNGAIAQVSGNAVGGTDDKFIRLKRTGDEFTAYYSTESEEGPWIQIGNPVTISMGTTVNVGLATTANDNSTLWSAQFDRVRILTASDPKPVDLFIKAILQGPWDGDEMQTDLLDGDMLPDEQPYNVAPWNYAGTECVDEKPANAVDWVLVQVRDPNDESVIIAQRACFVRNDGVLVDLDGAEEVFMGKYLTRSGFVSVIHRNHLAVMTQNAIIFD